jgi:hypothetical protein
MIADAAITPPDLSMLLGLRAAGAGVHAVLLYFVIYYGPMHCSQGAYRHNGMLSGKPAPKNAELAGADRRSRWNRLTQTASIQSTDLQAKTHKALGHIAEAGKLVMPQGVAAADAHRHLDKVIAIRDGEE